jgi:hypothetical protein
MQVLPQGKRWSNDMPEMTPGYKTTELYVVAAVLLPWIAQQVGLDASVITDNADELRKAIEAAHGGSDMPVWVAIIYVCGRKVLKWKGMK